MRVLVKQLLPHRPNLKYRVEYTVQGKRTRRFFDTLAEAKAFCATVGKVRRDVGLSAAKHLGPGQLRDAAAALKILRGLNVSLVDAAKFYRETHERRLQSERVSVLVNAVVAQKTKEGVSRVYWKDIESKGKAFADALEDPIAADVTVEQARRYLLELEGSVISRNNHRRVLAVVFNAGIERGTIAQNSFAAIKATKQARKEPGGLLTGSDPGASRCITLRSDHRVSRTRSLRRNSRGRDWSLEMERYQAGIREDRHTGISAQDERPASDRSGAESDSVAQKLADNVWRCLRRHTRAG